MTPLEIINIHNQTGMFITKIMPDVSDQEIEIKRTSTVFKRIKRKMDTIYLYLFGFNFRHMVGDRDLGLYWVSGISQDTKRIIRTIRYELRHLILNFIILYCKLRNEKKNGLNKWEKSSLKKFLDYIEHRNN